MILYIAKDQNGNVCGAALAKNEELARAFWLGAGIFPVSVEFFTPADFEEKNIGVLPITIPGNIKIQQKTPIRYEESGEI